MIYKFTNFLKSYFKGESQTLKDYLQELILINQSQVFVSREESSFIFHIQENDGRIRLASGVSQSSLSPETIRRRSHGQAQPFVHRHTLSLRRRVHTLTLVRHNDRVSSRGCGDHARRHEIRRWHVLRSGHSQAQRFLSKSHTRQNS